MDKLNRNREIVRSILSSWVEFDRRQPDPGVETLLIADGEQDHYMLLTIGWAGRRRIRQMRVFVRLIENKFWIEQDLTEEGIATELLRAGISAEDIVLAFQAPEMRQYTEFAAA
ncbi:MAG: XisI protein [Blastocatellia bacterium]